MPDLELGGIREIGLCSNGITFAAPNGESITAPVEFWIAAIVAALPERDRVELCKRVALMMSNEIRTYSPDGTQYRIAKVG